MQLVQQGTHPADDHVVGGAVQGLQLAVVAHMAGHFMGHDHACCTRPPAQTLMLLPQAVSCHAGLRLLTTSVPKRTM